MKIRNTSRAMLLIFLVLILAGCSADSQDKKIRSNLLIKEEFPKNLALTLFYESNGKSAFETISNESYKVKGEMLYKEDMEYDSGCYTMYPKEVLSEIASALNYEDANQLTEGLFMYKKGVDTYHMF